MQTLSWYVARLMAMSPREVSWRVRTSLRSRVDYAVAPLRRRPRRRSALLSGGQQYITPAFRVCDLDVGAWQRPGTSGEAQAWCQRLVERAERIAAHHLSFFDLDNKHLGDPIDWNRDHKSGCAAPLRFAPGIDYRDVRVTGDCKFVWEPNRHHQFVVLARAYRASGERRFAEAVVEQWDSWMAQCPFGIGMNWRSHLELGIRLINWVWAFDLIREANVLDQADETRWLQSCQAHIWEIARSYSRGSSAGNHRVGEAAGVYIATSYLSGLRGARAWRDEAHDMLEDEILRQTFDDGGPREQALGYHLFVLQFFLVCGLVGRRTGDEFSATYWERLERMLGFVAELAAGGDALPVFGDCDDGYVLDLGAGRPDAQALLTLGATVFAERDFGLAARGDAEMARWLPLTPQADDAALRVTSPARLRSTAFEHTGYYLLQSGTDGEADRISVVFDCGALGLVPLAGHGHADALSFTLRAFGRDVLVDPGTYDYFTYPEWRRYFRGTSAHNTIMIDGENQSELRGAFLWARPATAHCLAWQPSENGGTVAGRHDGYTRLSEPVVHSRTITLDGVRRVVTVRDDLTGRGVHDVQLNLHFAEDCVVTPRDGQTYDVNTGAGMVTAHLDPCLDVARVHGPEAPIGGWVSRGYHHKVPATTLVGRVQMHERLTVVCRFEIGAAR